MGGTAKQFSFLEMTKKANSSAPRCLLSSLQEQPWCSCSSASCPHVSCVSGQVGDTPVGDSHGRSRYTAARPVQGPSHPIPRCTRSTMISLPTDQQHPQLPTLELQNTQQTHSKVCGQNSETRIVLLQ